MSPAVTTREASPSAWPLTSIAAPPVHVISVDVEDYYHAEVFSQVVERAQWPWMASRVEANTRRLLDLFAEQGVEATFFVLGWVADRHPSLVRAIAAAGHELACHSYWHRLIYRLQPAEFREDTYRAKDAIEQIAGTRVFGYRAPTYSITPQSLWAVEVLAELGFTYDSSIYPIRHDRYGIPEAPRTPFRFDTASGPLVEFPIATFRPWGRVNMPFGGGGYLRLLPWWYTRLGMARATADGVPVVAYIHPWEIDPEQPRLDTPLASRLRHYTNLGRTYRRLRRLVEQNTFTSFRRFGLGTEWPAVNPSTWETV